MGQNHVRVYSEIADVVGIADPDVKAGGVVSNRFNVSYYTDATHLLKEELDAVSVCVPTEHHAKVALDVIRAGIPVLVEKPLAATVEEAKRIVDAAKKAGITLAVGHIERHNPAIAAVKRHVQEGQYGDLVTAAARRVSSFPGRVRDIGVVMDLGVHEIDVLRYLVGAPVESVFALGGLSGVALDGAYRLRAAAIPREAGRPGREKKDIFERIEQAIDACETAANILETILVKHA